MNIYHIRLRGQVDEDEINSMSPLHMARAWGDTAVTQFTVHTDQSDLIGLMCHLNGLDYIFLSVACVQQDAGNNSL